MPKSTSEEGSKEITIYKDKENDSPDFPVVLAVSTIPALISDIKTFLELESEKSIAGIVTSYNETLKIITNPKMLPPVATVTVVFKKGKYYFQMV